MLFRVPVTYRAVIVPKGRFKRQEVVCGEYVDVEVREVTDLDAPVALRWEETERDLSAAAVNGVHEVRLFDGRHFGAATSRNTDHLNAHIDIDITLRACETGEAHGHPLLRGTSYLREVAEGRFKRQEELEAKEIVTSGRADAIREAHRRAEDLLLVDGRLWLAIDEPVYRITLSGGYGVRHVRADIVNLAATRTAEQDHAFFRADRHEDMLDHCRDIIESERSGQELPDVPRIHVLIPEAVAYDDETPAFLSAAYSALNAGRTELDQKDRAAILAWVDFRDALADIRNDGEGRLQENLARLEDALETYRRDMTLHDVHRTEIDRALNRWRLRPMTHEPEPVTPPGIGYGG